MTVNVSPQAYAAADYVGGPRYPLPHLLTWGALFCVLASAFFGVLANWTEWSDFQRFLLTALLTLSGVGLMAFERSLVVMLGTTVATVGFGLMWAVLGLTYHSSAPLWKYFALWTISVGVFWPILRDRWVLFMTLGLSFATILAFAAARGISLGILNGSFFSEPSQLWSLVPVIACLGISLFFAYMPVGWRYRMDTDYAAGARPETLWLVPYVGALFMLTMPTCEWLLTHEAALRLPVVYVGVAVPLVFLLLPPFKPAATVRWCTLPFALVSLNIFVARFCTTTFDSELAAALAMLVMNFFLVWQLMSHLPIRAAAPHLEWVRRGTVATGGIFAFGGFLLLHSILDIDPTVTLGAVYLVIGVVLEGVRRRLPTETRSRTAAGILAEMFFLMGAGTIIWSDFADPMRAFLAGAAGIAACVLFRRAWYLLLGFAISAVAYTPAHDALSVCLLATGGFLTAFGHTGVISGFARRCGEVLLFTGAVLLATLSRQDFAQWDVLIYVVTILSVVQVTPFLFRPGRRLAGVLTAVLLCAMLAVCPETLVLGAFVSLVFFARSTTVGDNILGALSLAVAVGVVYADAHAASLPWFLMLAAVFAAARVVYDRPSVRSLFTGRAVQGYRLLWLVSISVALAVAIGFAVRSSDDLLVNGRKVVLAIEVPEHFAVGDLPLIYPINAQLNAKFPDLPPTRSIMLDTESVPATLGERPKHRSDCRRDGVVCLKTQAHESRPGELVLALPERWIFSRVLSPRGVNENIRRARFIELRCKPTGRCVASRLTDENGQTVDAVSGLLPAWMP